MATTPERLPSEVARHVLEALEPLVGRFTARKAVELVAQQCGAGLDTLEAPHVPEICEHLRPMLRTLLGATTTDNVLATIVAPYRSTSGS